ncbi:MAG: phenylalanine--tRNA ligase subunit beta [Chloroflexota bacterium]
MKVPISWLRDYVKIELPAEELGERLTMAGSEVKAIEKVGGWTKVVVGEVTAVAPHPNADRLKVATVDVGGQRLKSVCGAPNVAVGQKVPFAHIGAQFTDPESVQVVKLKKASIRGVASQGMILSERELGISERHEGIMVLPADARTGAPLDDCLSDAVFDLDITPNRPDCLSVIGIAWEVAALARESVSLPDLQYEEAGDAIERHASVEIQDADLCRRYCATLLNNVSIGPSPPWMQKRLLSCGMRPINNIVDVTNYVMLEYGQPLHAFDFDNLAQGSIIVRRATDGETMVTIDDLDRSFARDTLLITDPRGPVAIAGVMGGAASEVTDQTTSVLIESANFNAASIRRTSAAQKLRSEASLRFEKGLSPELALHALRRATQLMARWSGATVAKGIIDVYPGKTDTKPILLTTKRVKQVLGMDMRMDEISRVLTSLGFVCHPIYRGELSIDVPYWRTDIRVADDLVEELARIVGYDHIPTTLPSGGLPAFEPDAMRVLRRRVQDILIGCGMQEIITYPLTSREALAKALPGREPAAMKVANRITPEQEYLRTTLRIGLLQTLSRNDRHDEEGIALFEVGKVYLPRERDLPDEQFMAAGVLAGARLAPSWHGGSEKVDFYDAKGIVEVLLSRLGVSAHFQPDEDDAFSMGRLATITVKETRIGIIGELHPRVAERFEVSIHPVYLFEFDLQQLPSHAQAAHKYQPVPRFPATTRDMALVVDRDVLSQKVYDIIVASPLVAEASLFDVYAGDQVPRDKKSLAFRIVYQSPHRTLTDQEVNREQDRILKKLHQQLGAVLRT